MLIPVILSGGAGARLWPVSREAWPKPFIRLADGRSLLRRTYERAAQLDGVAALATVTNREHFFLARDEYALLDSRLDHAFLLEPVGRNTAAAIAMAALWAMANHGADAELLILPADHLIDDQAAFADAVAAARELAASGALVTFGIPPTRPETGFGYIECGAARGPGLQVARFVEKPSAEVAARFVAAGNFLWNSGMFCFRAGSFLAALGTCDALLLQKAQSCWQATPPRNGERIDLDPESFAALPDISVDYAVMEKHRDVAVVRAGFDWNDIGSWNALGALVPADAQGNRSVGETVLMATTDCYIQSNSRMVAAVGLSNLLVIDTPDALLVADRDRAQEVKQVVQQLKLANHASHQLHRTVHRPWGTYTVLEEGEGYKIKRIVLKPGASISLQLHRHRSEHWIVISGTAGVVDNDREFTVSPGESTFIAAGHKHRLLNPGAEELVIIEVQTGSYVGEDDIVRFEDVYGRK